jgi:hypothetical protein
MKARKTHVPADRLMALAFVVRAPEGDSEVGNVQDREALAHVSRCDSCAAELARLTSEADGLRGVAFQQADEVFDEAMLDAQRTRILDRLAHLGQAARVLHFPTRPRDAAMPVSTASRRWISVAAAAGLIIGLVAGQMLHFIPTSRVDRDPGTLVQSAARPSGPVLVPAAFSGPLLSDDELLDEVEAAVQLRRAQSLQALDALTPTAADLLAR